MSKFKKLIKAICTIIISILDIIEIIDTQKQWCKARRYIDVSAGDFVLRKIMDNLRFCEAADCLEIDF